MHFEVYEPSRYASVAATRVLSLAVRAAPRDDGLTDPNNGPDAVRHARSPADYRGCAAERRCGPPVSEVSGGNSPSSCAASTDI